MNKLESAIAYTKELLAQPIAYDELYKRITDAYGLFAADYICRQHNCVRIVYTNKTYMAVWNGD